MNFKKWFFLIVLFKFYLISGQNFEREHKIGLDAIANNNGVAVADFDNDNDSLIHCCSFKRNPDDPLTFSRLMQ